MDEMQMVRIRFILVVGVFRVLEGSAPQELVMRSLPVRFFGNVVRCPFRAGVVVVG